MSFRTDNKDYEAWLATQCDVVESDIAYKHSPDEEEPRSSSCAPPIFAGPGKSATGVRS